MIRHLFIFCFLVLLVFSCRSSKKATEDDPALLECRQKSLREFEEAENYFIQKNYDIAKNLYQNILKYECLEELKHGYKKNKTTVAKTVNSRIAQINKIYDDELKSKQDMCIRIYQYAENLQGDHQYERARIYYLRYQNSDCSERDSMINLKIKILDSLINLEEN
jgi:hypothetical protein